jgi:hypothetical protein
VQTSLKQYISQFSKNLQTTRLKSSLQKIVVDLGSAGDGVIHQTSDVRKKAKLLFDHSFSKIDKVIKNYKLMALSKKELLEKFLGQPIHKAKKSSISKKLKTIKRKSIRRKPRP